MMTATRNLMECLVLVAGVLTFVAFAPSLAAQDHHSQVAAASLRRGLEAFEAPDFPWNRDEAERQFTRALRAEPADPTPLLHLARLHDRAGNDLTAIGWYRAYLAAAPQALSAPDIRRRLAALDASTEKRATAVYELAYGALRAIPPRDWFAFDPQLESLPWAARFLMLCSLRNDQAKVKEILEAADPSWRDGLRQYLLSGRTAQNDWDGALAHAAGIENRLLRWQGYCLIATSALRVLNPDAIGQLVDHIERASSAQGGKPDQPESRAGANLLLIVRAQARLDAGRVNEARALFDRLPAVPSADDAIPWFLKEEYVQSLALAEQFALVNEQDIALAACQRATKLYRLQMDIEAGKLSTGAILGSSDPELFMRQFVMNGRVVRFLILDALDSNDWSRRVREIDMIDERAAGDALLERAELQARLGRKQDLRETLRRMDTWLEGREADLISAIRGEIARRVDPHLLDIDTLLGRLSGDDPFLTADREWIERVVERQIRAGDLGGATRTLEWIPRAEARSQSLLKVLIARAAKGEIGLAQALAQEIEDSRLRQQADVVLLAAISQNPDRADAVDLLGPERAWSGIDLAAANELIVSLLIARGELASARHINLHQEDPVVAARCAGRIAAAELARGDVLKTDATVRQALDRICPRGPEPYLALADELALARDVLGLRTVARRLRDVLGYRDYRFDLLHVAQLQEYAGDMEGARQTRQAADWTSLAARPGTHRLRDDAEYWRELISSIDSHSLSCPPPTSLFGFAPQREPLYYDVPQRATAQKEILSDLRDKPPWDVFRRTTGLAEQILRGLLLVRHAAGPGVSQ